MPLTGVCGILLSLHEYYFVFQEALMDTQASLVFTIELLYTDTPPFKGTTRTDVVAECCLEVSHAGGLAILKTVAMLKTVGEFCLKCWL